MTKFFVSPSDKERAFKLGMEIGAPIPPGIDILMWPLPILEKLVEENAKLSARVAALEAAAASREQQ